MGNNDFGNSNRSEEVVVQDAGSTEKKGTTIKKKEKEKGVPAPLVPLATIHEMLGKADEPVEPAQLQLPFNSTNSGK